MLASVVYTVSQTGPLSGDTVNPATGIPGEGVGVGEGVEVGVAVGVTVGVGVGPGELLSPLRSKVDMLR